MNDIAGDTKMLHAKTTIKRKIRMEILAAHTPDGGNCASEFPNPDSSFVCCVDTVKAQ